MTIRSMNIEQPVNHTTTQWSLLESRRSWFVELETIQDRRGRSRVTVLVPARVRGVDSCGKAFREDEHSALLDNFSVSGAFLRMRSRVEVGQQLFFIFAFPGQTQAAAAPQARIAVLATVRRTETLTDNGYGVGVEIKRHRFVYGGEAVQAVQP